MLSDFLGGFLLCSKIVDFSHTGLVLCPVNIAPYFFLPFCALVFEKTRAKKHFRHLLLSFVHNRKQKKPMKFFVL